MQCSAGPSHRAGRLISSVRPLNAQQVQQGCKQVVLLPGPQPLEKLNFLIEFFALLKQKTWQVVFNFIR